MEKLKKNITMEEINAIIAVENQKAAKEERYEPANNLTLLTEDELRYIENFKNLQKFKKENQDRIYELECEIHKLYKENGIEYLEDFEDGEYCDFYLKGFIEDGISFEQILIKAEEVMDVFEYEFYTLKVVYAEIDNLLY